MRHFELLRNPPGRGALPPTPQMRGICDAPPGGIFAKMKRAGT